MKTIEINVEPIRIEGEENANLLRAAGVKRIHRGWYKVWYNGVNPDPSNVCYAKRNPKAKQY